MHHMRGARVVGTVILSPEEQKRRVLLEQADSEMEEFLDAWGEDDASDEQYNTRISHLAQALHLANKANSNKIVARRLEMKS